MRPCPHALPASFSPAFVACATSLQAVEGSPSGSRPTHRGAGGPHGAIWRWNVGEGGGRDKEGVPLCSHKRRLSSELVTKALLVDGGEEGRRWEEARGNEGWRAPMRASKTKRGKPGGWPAMKWFEARTTSAWCEGLPAWGGGGRGGGRGGKTYSVGGRPKTLSPKKKKTSVTAAPAPTHARLRPHPPHK